MAVSTFTAYIFDEDHRKLNGEAASGMEKSGSLFGQWTSTGNPVVHYVVPSRVDSVTSARIGAELWKCYRICHIGEWRSVRQYSGHSDYERSRLRSKFDGGNPKRFLILDVEETKICPYLFDNKSQSGRGKVDKLQGENPFNRTDIDPQYGDLIPHHEEKPTPAQRRDWHQPQPRQQLQPAVTNKCQWYTGDRGNETLEKIFNDFKRIAYQGQVEMSRDKTTEDISMSFTDQRRRNWQVDFPSTFPAEGAILIENPDSRGRERKCHRQAPTSKASQAVKNMISYIQ